MLLCGNIPLVAGRPGEAVGEGVGDAEVHGSGVNAIGCLKPVLSLPIQKCGLGAFKNLNDTGLYIR